MRNDLWPVAQAGENSRESRGSIIPLRKIRSSLPVIKIIAALAEEKASLIVDERGG